MGMIPADYPKFRNVLILLAERYHRNFSEESLQHYFTHLQKFHIDTVCHVIDYWDHNPHHKKWPNVGELIAVIKSKSTTEYAKVQDEDFERVVRLKELEDEFTLVCKQICANGINTKAIMGNPIMQKLMKANGKVAEQINRDYSAYKTELTNEQLYEKQEEIRQKISNMRK